MLKKFLPVILCFILYHSIPVSSQNYSSTYNTDCTDYPAISKVEENVFGTAFPSENIYLRMNRLEDRLLGAEFPQEALCDRIDRIYKVASNGSSSAYDQTTAQNPDIPSSVGLLRQSLFNGYNNNSSYGNYNSSQNRSTLMQILDMLVSPFVTELGGGNFSQSNGFYTPEYQEEIIRNQNLNFGAGVRILH